MVPAGCVGRWAWSGSRVRTSARIAKRERGRNMPQNSAGWKVRQRRVCEVAHDRPMRWRRELLCTFLVGTFNPMTSLPTPEFIALQRALAGRYSLDRELGRGGMGIVYLARDVSLERPVAIKLLPPALAALPGYRDRFVREARTAAALAHPHIVPIHAVEERDGLVYFVMEYIAGETLGERIRRAGPLGADEATRILREVAWALGHAHGRGVIHRDIKPDNILLEAGSGRAVVTDLGIAHAEGTEVSGAAGTPHYMSPELLAGGAPSVASDLYALGVTAW